MQTRVPADGRDGALRPRRQPRVRDQRRARRHRRPVLHCGLARRAPSGPGQEAGARRCSRSTTAPLTYLQVFSENAAGIALYCEPGLPGGVPLLPLRRARSGPARAAHRQAVQPPPPAAAADQPLRVGQPVGFGAGGCELPCSRRNALPRVAAVGLGLAESSSRSTTTATLRSSQRKRTQAVPYSTSSGSGSPLSSNNAKIRRSASCFRSIGAMAGMMRPGYVTEQDTFVEEVRRMCADSVTAGSSGGGVE